MLFRSNNDDSIKVLEGLGLKFEKMIQFPQHSAASRLFAFTTGAAELRGDLSPL